MNIAAITMVYNDKWALAQWVRCYAKLVGLENLYVIAHGKDPEVERIVKGANIITIPRNTLDEFDVTRNRVLNGLQASLSNVFDWILRTDVDELIVVDPTTHASLSDALSQCKSEAIFALGCDLVQSDEGHDVLFTGHYSKAFAVSDDTRLYRHGIRVRSKLASQYRYQMPQGIYLVHLKYANKAALKASNLHRKAVALGAGKGLPGTAWQDPARDARKMYGKLAEMDSISWKDASSQAYADLSTNPLRDKSLGIVKCRSERFTKKTQPPVWFPKLNCSHQGQGLEFRSGLLQCAIVMKRAKI